MSTGTAYTVTFADGTTFDTILNGNNYMVAGDVVAQVSAANSKSVTIKDADGNVVETYNNPVIMRNAYDPDENETGICLRALTDEERTQAALEARLSYLEMIGGV